MALNVGTFSSAFAVLSNAAKTMNRSDGCIALPLLGERAGVRVDHLPSGVMKRCAPKLPVSGLCIQLIGKQKGPKRPGRFGLASAVALGNLRLSLGGLGDGESRSLGGSARQAAGPVALQHVTKRAVERTFLAEVRVALY